MVRSAAAWHGARKALEIRSCWLPTPFLRSADPDRTWQPSLNYEIESAFGVHRGRMELIGALRSGNDVMVNVVPMVPEGSSYVRRR